MIDVKQAIQRVRTYAFDLLNVPDPLLEEVESDDDTFKITLSFPARTHLSSLNPVLWREGPREYKVFEVDKEKGELVKMRIRPV